MRTLLVNGIILVFILFSGCGNAVEKYNDSISPELQDSVMLVAAAHYANFCAGCHYEDLGWFLNREWKYGHSEEDIYESTRTGYPDFGMPGYKDTFTEDELRALSRYIHLRLDLGRLQKPPIRIGEVVESEKQKFRVDTVITGLSVPWGLAFLPGGDYLVAEREGKLLRYGKEGKLIAEIAGLPPIAAQGQGGLMDIRLHPDYSQNGWLYLAYNAPASKGDGWNTALARARVIDNALADFQVLFKGVPDTRAAYHFGCKITFDGKGHVFFGIGDRGNWHNAQDLTVDAGKIHRIKEDGSIPVDNPFFQSPGARPSIWSYGHRNSQGLVFDPITGKLWETEHGPKGGDELNLVVPGKNYGWPVISYGINYDGTIITTDTAKAGMEQPIIYWTPSIAPCGMTFVPGDQYPGWKGNILVGSLRFRNMVRVELSGDRVVHQEILLHDIGRVRNIEVSPSGLVHVAVENPGVIFKLTPVK